MEIQRLHRDAAGASSLRRASDWGMSRARSNCGRSLHTHTAALGSVILPLEWEAWKTHKLGTRVFIPWPPALLKDIHSIWLSRQNCGQSSEIHRLTICSLSPGWWLVLDRAAEGRGCCAEHRLQEMPRPFSCSRGSNTAASRKRGRVEDLLS